MDREEVFRVRERQGPEQDAVDEAVDCGRRSDAEGKRENRGCSEARRFAELAQSEVKIGV